MNSKQQKEKHSFQLEREGINMRDRQLSQIAAPLLGYSCKTWLKLSKCDETNNVPLVYMNIKTRKVMWIIESVIIESECASKNAITKKPWFTR